MSTEPLTAELCRLHLTVSKRFLAKLDGARAGESHARRGASSGDVLELGLDLLLERQARRRGETDRPQTNPRRSGPGHVPAAVRRAVWTRDGGKCQWPLSVGGVCGSTLRVQVDHVIPKALGGPSTVENCRLLCRMHNDLAARLVYGNDWMDAFTSCADG
jgi:5-methylcytosine-specific restriction endonuclease McrA